MKVEVINTGEQRLMMTRVDNLKIKSIISKVEVNRQLGTRIIMMVKSRKKLSILYIYTPTYINNFKSKRIRMYCWKSQR